MGEDTKKALTPKLRFPEFRDADGWQEKSIEALARVSQGGTPDTSNMEYWGGMINWLTPAEMNKDDSPYIASTKRTLTEAGLANCSSELLPSRSVIISTRAPIGHLAINTTPMAINQGCRGLVPVENAYFLYSALLHAKARLIDLGAGNTFKELSGSALKRFVIPAPPPAEQQKIADCLTSLDELIAAQGRKVEALKAHKKGLMQQLFPREGETVPRLRFPEFRDAGQWIPRSMADLLDRASQPVEVDDDVLYREIGVRSHGKGVFHKEPVTGKALGNKRVFWVTPNAFVVNIIFAWEQAVATTTDAESGMIASHRFPMYVGKQDKCDVEFLKRAFLTPYGKHVLGLASPGGAGRNRTLGQKEFEKIELIVPEDVKEQQRIADCLSALDDRITAESQKLDALKLHKRGLMQQLFPAADRD